MMVHSLRKKPIGHPKQINVSRADNVLRLDQHPFCGRHATGHHVRHAIDPRQAAVAGRAEASRSSRPVKLRASRQGRMPVGDQRDRRGLASSSNQAPAVE
jgi:hypothetical protein